MIWFSGFLCSCLRQRLHERGFICNRIDFDAFTPSVYTTPTETVIETATKLFVERFQNDAVSSVV